MDLGFIHESDAHTPSCERPDQLQKSLGIEFIVIDIHDKIAILVIGNLAFQHMPTRRPLLKVFQPFDLGSSFGNFDRPVGRVRDTRLLRGNDVVQSIKDIRITHTTDLGAKHQVHRAIGRVCMLDDGRLSISRDMHLIDCGVWWTSQAQGRSPVGTQSDATLEIRGQRIRLHGIDAPESRQLCATAEGQRWRCGQEAALSLADRIGRRQVSCTLRDIDRYGRFIAVCHQDGTDLNGWLVREGWAVAYRRYSRDYIRDENEARSARRNIWSGRFDMPWDWRRAQRGG